MADVQLEGVLRSELSDRLTQHLAQYIKEPVVRATPLVRVAILGSVKNPGYFYTAADIPLSDVIMKAGGPTQVANINNVVVRRNAEVIWDPKGMRTAIADGLSIDRLHMRAGDEIYVAEQRKFPWWSVISTGVSVLLLIATQFR